MAMRESSQWDPHLARCSLPLALGLYQHYSRTLGLLLRGAGVVHRFRCSVQRYSGAMGLLAWLGMSRLLVCRGTARRTSWMLPVWLQVGPVAVSVTRRGGQLHHGNANGHVLHRMR